MLYLYVGAMMSESSIIMGLSKGNNIKVFLEHKVIQDVDIVN